MSLASTIAMWIFIPAFAIILIGLLWFGLLSPLLKSLKKEMKKKKKPECASCKTMAPDVVFCSVCGRSLK